MSWQRGGPRTRGCRGSIIRSRFQKVVPVFWITRISQSFWIIGNCSRVWVRSYPSALFINSDGTLAKSHIGYMNKDGNKVEEVFAIPSHWLCYRLVSFLVREDRWINRNKHGDD